MGIRWLLPVRIHEILIREWDPIGVGDNPEAQDEYDDYGAIIIGLLQSGVGADGIAEYLYTVQTERMGLLGNRLNDNLVAQKIFSAYLNDPKPTN